MKSERIFGYVLGQPHNQAIIAYQSPVCGTTTTFDAVLLANEDWRKSVGVAIIPLTEFSQLLQDYGLEYLSMANIRHQQQVPPQALLNLASRHLKGQTPQARMAALSQAVQQSEGQNDWHMAHLRLHQVLTAEAVTEYMIAIIRSQAGHSLNNPSPPQHLELLLRG